MTDGNYSDAQLRQAYDQAFQTYMHRDNVTGIDVGYRYVEGKRTDEIAVRIHVKEKIPEFALEAVAIFPKDIDGVPLDIIQANYHPHIAIAESVLERQQRQDTIQPGISVGHPQISAGTFGTVVYDNVTGKPCILSNWHVLAGSSQAKPGDEILQPGTHDGGRSPRDKVAELERFIIDQNGDAAIALLEAISDRSLDVTQFKTGVSLTSARMAKKGDILEKSGRTTGVTKGKVDSVFGSYKLTYSVGTIAIQGFKIVSIIEGNPNNEEISSGGDSGSVWYDPQTKEGVGLHFAGETNPDPRAEHAIACHLPTVLSLLNVSLTPPSVPQVMSRGLSCIEEATSVSPNLKKIKEEMQALADIFTSMDDIRVGKPVEVEKLRKAETKLKNLEFRLQFELLRAEDQSDWTLADFLYDGIERCQQALNAVRGAIFRNILIEPDHEQIIAQFRSIRRDIDRAIQTQKIFDFVIRLAVLVRRFVL